MNFMVLSFFYAQQRASAITEQVPCQIDIAQIGCDFIGLDWKLVRRTGLVRGPRPVFRTRLAAGPSPRLVWAGELNPAPAAYQSDGRSTVVGLPMSKRSTI